MAKAYGLNNINTRLSASTEIWIQKQPQNVIFNRHPGLSLLRSKAKMQPGGESINANLEYVIPTSVGSYSGFQVLNTTPQDFATTINYRFRHYFASVNVSGEMRRENAQNSVFDIVQGMTENAMKGVVDLMSTDVWAASQSGNALDTLPAYTATTGTVGQISATGNTWWQSTVTASGTFASQGLDDVRTLYNSVSNEGGERPDLGFTTQSVAEFWEKYALVKGKLDIPNTKKVDLGIDAMEYKGASIVWDADIPSGQFFFVNSDYTSLVIDSGVNFKSRGFVEARDGDHATNLILFRGNLVTTKRSSLGKLTGITA